MTVPFFLCKVYVNSVKELSFYNKKGVCIHLSSVVDELSVVESRLTLALGACFSGRCRCGEGRQWRFDCIFCSQMQMLIL